MKTHYLEVVAKDVEAQCTVLAAIHGVSFGKPVPDLGSARVAESKTGSLIGVRAPMAEHEQPIVRAYVEVPDIVEATKKAKSAGAVIAYPPTKQGDTGTWAIVIQGGVQHGLWQRPNKR